MLWIFCSNAIDKKMYQARPCVFKIQSKGLYNNIPFPLPSSLQLAPSISSRCFVQQLCWRPSHSGWGWKVKSSVWYYKFGHIPQQLLSSSESWKAGSTSSFWKRIHHQWRFPRVAQRFQPGTLQALVIRCLWNLFMVIRFDNDISAIHYTQKPKKVVTWNLGVLSFSQLISYSQKRNIANIFHLPPSLQCGGPSMVRLKSLAYIWYKVPRVDK